MKRVEFKLTMPNVGSWNGKWSGSGRDYLLFKNLTDKKCDELGIFEGDYDKAYWHHNFGDGWSACVYARILTKGEKKKKSAGFCGYEWMVSNIVWYNQTERFKENNAV